MSRSIAVLGAGHGGLAAAADLSLKGHDVRLFSRSPAALAHVESRTGIALTGAAGEGFARIATVTPDLGEAIRGADLICLVIPTTSHEDYARRLAPILADGQPIFLNPGHTGGGLQFVTELRRNGYQGEVRCCESSTLTYGCRIQPSGEVRVWSVVPALPFAAFPGKHAEELHALLLDFYPAVQLRLSVLETGFANLNAVEHPPQALLNVGWLEHTHGDYLFYYEGTTPSVGRAIDAVDRERMAVARAMDVESLPFVEAFFDAGYTTESAVQDGTAYQALHESAPNRWVKGPRSLDHRYVHEDVGHGLVPWAAWGDLAGVETPTMDALIEIASVVNGRDYAREGLTLRKMGLEGIDRDQLDAFLWEGRCDGR
ncbi:MAG: NAD/NADP octopine/nopaline dehydrogenase family protein [Chloroflexota bacterium]